MKVKVKIDGLTNLNDINMVIEEGVDLIGFITGFPESPRNLKFEQIAEVVHLHQHVLGYTLNSKLGFDHLKYIYTVTTEHTKSEVAVATLNGKIVGLIVLSLNPIELKKQMERNLL